MDGTLIGTTTPGQSGPGGNDNEEVPSEFQNWDLTIRCSLVSNSRHNFFLGW